MSQPAKRRPLSTQAHLLLLAVALVGPLLVFTGLILLRFADAERGRLEQNVRDSVSDLAVDANWPTRRRSAGPI